MNLKNVFARLLRDEQGQDMVEYALLAAFISIVAVTAITQIGSDVAGYTGLTANNNALWQTPNPLPPPAAQ